MTNNTKYTPGPWKIEGTEVVGRSNIYRAGISVARINNIRDTLPTPCELGSQEANARLIAAAPELLELVREIAEQPCKFPAPEDMETGCCQTCRARTTFAKATGQAA